ncbi:MAG: DUF5305 family protein [Bacilli bacterium]
MKEIFIKEFPTKKICIKNFTKIYVGIIIIILMTLICAFSFKGAISFKTDKSLYYNEASDLNYRVYLKPNEYFEKPFLEKDRQYIANLIDYIDVNFKYNFNASNEFDYNYNYFITGLILATDKDDENKIVYKKKTILKPMQTAIVKNSSNFKIDENLKIDYNYYNKIINNFKKDYSLALNSKLTVTLNVEIVGKYKYAQNDIKSKQKMDVVIPLSEQTINIGVDYTEINNAKILEEKASMEIINKILLIIFVITLIFDIIFVIDYVRFLEKLKPKKTIYDKKLNKIIKQYDRAIVKTKNMPNIKKLNIIDIEQFAELLDARENLEKPILYVEIVPKKSSWFLIITTKEVYRYILDLENLEEEEKNGKK